MWGHIATTFNRKLAVHVPLLRRIKLTEHFLSRLSDELTSVNRVYTQWRISNMATVYNSLVFVSVSKMTGCMCGF
jgi:hypothetical protein